MLKVAEEKVVDGIVKKVTKGAKQSKIATKVTNRTKAPTVPKKSTKKKKPAVQSRLDDVDDNPYLNMISAKKKRNSERLDSIAEELEELKQGKNPTLKKRTTRISIKTATKRQPKCKIDHLDVTIFKEEGDKRYCNEKGDLHGVACASCYCKFGEKDGVGVVVPSVKCPIYVCSGRTLHDCTYSLCNTCHVKRSSNGIGTRKRLRRK